MVSYQNTRINPKKLDKSQLKFLFILVPMSLFMIWPIIYIFSTAFKPLEELFAFPPQFLVRNPTLQNFKYLFYDIRIFRYLFNSLIVTVPLC